MILHLVEHYKNPEGVLHVVLTVVLDSDHNIIEYKFQLRY